MVDATTNVMSNEVSAEYFGESYAVRDIRMKQMTV